MTTTMRMDMSTSMIMERAMRTSMTMNTAMGMSMPTIMNTAMRTAIVIPTIMNMVTSMDTNTAMTTMSTSMETAAAMTMARRMWRPVRTHILSRSTITPRAIPTTVTARSAIRI